MIERVERLSRSGGKDAAKQLLEQLQQMLENLRMAQPQSGENDMEQALNELGDMIRGRSSCVTRPSSRARGAIRARQAKRPEHRRSAAGSAGPPRAAEEVAAGTRQTRHGTARPAGPSAARRVRRGKRDRTATARRATARMASARPTARMDDAGGKAGEGTRRRCGGSAEDRRWKPCARAPRSSRRDAAG